MNILLPAEVGLTSAQDPQFKSSFMDVYTASTLQVPWHAVLGEPPWPGLMLLLDRARAVVLTYAYMLRPSYLLLMP